MRETTSTRINEAGKLGASFIANVIDLQHGKRALKIHGLVNLLRAGHDVRIGNDIDHLLIDGYTAPWNVLVEWAGRTK